MALHIPASPPPTLSIAAHIQSMPAHSPSRPDHIPSMSAHTPLTASHIPSMPVHSLSMPAHSPSNVGLDAPASPLHIPMHTPSITPSTENPRSINGKSTIHRRRLSPRQRHFYTGPNASPRRHLTLITVSPISFFSFSFAFGPINFPFAPRHQQPYPQPYSLTYHLVR